MKKVALLISLSLTLAASSVFAKERPNHEPQEMKVGETLVQFGGLGVAAFILQKGSTAMGFGASSRAVLHLSNVLVQGGVIFGKPVLTDLGIRALITAGAASVANNPLIKNNLNQLPFVGPYLSDAGTMGVSITTVAFYDLLKMGYIGLVDELPASMQNMVRGE